MKVDTKEIAGILGISEAHIPLLVGAFLDESKDILAKLLESVSSNNYPDIALHSHSIKGSSANLRLNDISECALGLEHAAKASDASYDYSGESQKLKALVEDVEL
jgi:HPt (histidine-containing phosphotransfer) domain-containing protein